MKFKYFLTLTFILVCLLPVYGQVDSVYYQFGIGSVAGGATQTTDNFFNAPIPLGEQKVIPNPEGTNNEPMLAPINESETLPPYVYVEDPNATENPSLGAGQTVLLQKFPGCFVLLKTLLSWCLLPRKASFFLWRRVYLLFLFSLRIHFLAG